MRERFNEVPSNHFQVGGRFLSTKHQRKEIGMLQKYLKTFCDRCGSSSQTDPRSRRNRVLDASICDWRFIRFRAPRTLYGLFMHVISKVLSRSHRMFHVARWQRVFAVVWMEEKVCIRRSCCQHSPFFPSFFNRNGQSIFSFPCSSNSRLSPELRWL